jgi:hypothetical protein
MLGPMEPHTMERSKTAVRALGAVQEVMVKESSAGQRDNAL